MILRSYFCMTPKVMYLSGGLLRPLPAYVGQEYSSHRLSHSHTRPLRLLRVCIVHVFALWEET